MKMENAATTRLLYNAHNLFTKYILEIIDKNQIDLLMRFDTNRFFFAIHTQN